MDDYIMEQLVFWTQVGKSDGFDVEHLMDTKPSSCSLSTRKFEDNDDYPTMIVLPARLGIHKYNMIQGTNLQLSSIEKLNKRSSVVCCCYYITLVAKDPASGGSLVSFQTKFVDEGFDIKELTCPIARLKYGPRDNSEEEEPEDDCYQLKLPDEWPSEDVFNNKKRFYVMKKSELRKYDWVRLYMEISFYNANMILKNLDLSKLVIMKVAVETEENVEPPSERLKARNAVFYIRLSKTLL
ncbi:uncharacterized protein At4g17700 isoform X2 [Capsella rubella]|uniref:uncharacterized protein At4g17700 isoform X2 n=1 Tax=Capsella rubella TaxID=81985 RepID=UPI000CD56D46|nr:uncharacterized protein At4g17700 isoform X2 [Capsella rubella]